MLSLDRKLVLLPVRLGVSIAEHSAVWHRHRTHFNVISTCISWNIHFTEAAFSRFRITSTQINISILKPGRGSAWNTEIWITEQNRAITSTTSRSVGVWSRHRNHSETIPLIVSLSCRSKVYKLWENKNISLSTRSKLRLIFFLTTVEAIRKASFKTVALQVSLQREKISSTPNTIKTSGDF